MSDARNRHRPVIAGVGFWSRNIIPHPRRAGQQSLSGVRGGGTITALAVRKSDRHKMLATCQRCVAGKSRGNFILNPGSNRVMLQPTDVMRHLVGEKPKYAPLSRSGTRLDAAACEVVDGVGVSFNIHGDHPNRRRHPNRKIIAGVMEPTPGMEVMVASAWSGEVAATAVRQLNRITIGGVQWSSVWEFKTKPGNTLQRGDSGSGCFVRVTRGLRPARGFGYSPVTIAPCPAPEHGRPPIKSRCFPPIIY